MTEPKSTRADLPEEEAPAYDEPPAGPADPLFEDESAPEVLPEEPQVAPEPDLPEDLFTVTDAAAPEAEAEPEPEPVAELFAAPEPVAELFAAPEPEPEPEPELLAEPEPLPEAEPEPVVEAAPAEPEPEPQIEPEPETVEEVAAVAADEALDDPHADIFGPETWEPVAPPPKPEPAPRPTPRAAASPSLTEVFAPAAAEAAAAPRYREPQPTPLTAAPGADADMDVKRSAFTVYLLYLSALVVVGIPLPIGAWLAYDRKKDAPAWLRSHYIYQIRTFWICMGGLAFSGLVLFLPFALFPLTIVAIVVWLVARCFFGMVRLHRGEPIFNPQTWIV